MRFALIILVTLLSACASSKRTYIPDGSSGYIINCPGAALNWGHCYEKAGKICGSSGYVVIDKSGDSNSTFSANQFGIYSGSSINRSMIIKCKAEP